jgi:hypothetical protein
MTRALLLAALVAPLCAPLVAMSGCKSGYVNELLVEVVTDISNEQVDRVELEVRRAGAAPLRLSWRLEAGKAPVKLPATFGLYSTGDRSPTVDVTASGFLGTDLIVRRSARTAPLPGERRLLRLALDSGCRGHVCDAGQTCIASECAAPDIDAHWLPDVAQAGKIACGSPGYLDTATGVILPFPNTECAEGMRCVEGACLGPQEGTVIATPKGGTGPQLGTLKPGAAPIE